MLYLKSLHIVAMVAWFAGLFYLPRLFVYHSLTSNKDIYQQFKIMEQRLYYGITYPAGIATSLLGGLLIGYQANYYLNARWMQLKLGLVALLWGYHLICGYFVERFKQNANKRSSRFFRIFNEIPLLFLLSIVILVVTRPF